MNRDDRQVIRPMMMDVLLPGSAIRMNGGIWSLIPDSGSVNPVIVSLMSGYWNRFDVGLSNSLSDSQRPLTLAKAEGIPDSHLSFAAFVEARFVPEHVRLKTTAGQTHYQAIMKHLLTPELVNRIFTPPQGIGRSRLRTAPGWPYLDDVKLCDIKAEDVQALIAAAIAAGYSPQTVKHIKNVMFAIIAHAQLAGYVSGPNPASLVKLGKIVRRKQRDLTFEQTKAVLQALDYPAREIALFAISTDMNLGEICDLRWKHVNLDTIARSVDGEIIPAMSMTINIPPHKSSSLSRRSEGRNRNVEIREPLLSTLNELRRISPQGEGCDPVLVSKTGGPNHPSKFRMNFWKQIGRQVEIPWLTWQVLRRARSSFVREFLAQLSPARSLGQSGVLNEARNAELAPDPIDDLRDIGSCLGECARVDRSPRTPLRMRLESRRGLRVRRTAE